MSPLTAAVSFVADHLGEPVERLDADGIQQARASVRPTNRLYTAFTGAADREVGITYGTAPARDDHEIPLRIYRPRALRDSARDVPVVMWFHGGGWVLGNVVDHDPICTLVAAGVGCVVVSVDYRMAPDHRGARRRARLRRRDDVGRRQRRRAARRHHRDGRRGRLGRRQPRGGRRPGAARPRGHAAAPPGTDLPGDRPDDVLAVGARARERGDPHQARRWTPFATTTSRPGHDPRDPLLSPLFGRLDGLPPALVQTADVDPIRDDGIRYADALRAAGVPVRLTNYLRVPHGFASMPGAAPAVARQQRWELVTELRTALRPPR